MTDTGIGPQIVDTWRGWLVFEYLPDDLQRAEDSTQAWDYHRTNCGYVTWTSDATDNTLYFLRDATDTEQQLLTHLSYTLPAEGDADYPLQTRVSYITGSLRNRRWPALETDTTT